MSLQRRKSEDLAVEWERVPLQEEFVFVAPSLLEFLVRSSWPEGDARFTGTLMLMWEGGSYKAWLHDRDSKEGLFVTAQTMEGLFQLVESTLSKGSGEWRPDKGTGVQQSRKRP